MTLGVRQPRRSRGHRGTGTRQALTAMSTGEGRLAGSMGRVLVVLLVQAFVQACGGDDATTRPKAWGAARLVWNGDNPTSRTPLQPAIGFDGAGSAVAVWLDESGYRLLTSRFTTGTWSQARLLDSLDAGDVRSFALAVAEDGTALVVWLQDVDGEYRGTIWARRYSGGAWSPPESIDGGGGEAAGWPAVAIHSNGEAVVVWHRAYERGGDLLTTRASAAGSWGEPALLAPNRGFVTGGAQIATSLRGDVFVVWLQNALSRSQTWGSRYDPRTGWAPGTPLGGPTSALYSPKLVADANGNATAVWTEGMAHPIASYASRYEPATGWGRAELLHEEGGAVELTQASNGDVLVLLSPRGESYLTSRFMPGVGWSSSESFPLRTNLWGLDFALDASGPAFMAWSEITGGASRVSSNRLIGSAWTTPDMVQGPLQPNAIAHWPAVAADGRGNALAIWTQVENRRLSVWSNYYANR